VLAAYGWQHARIEPVPGGLINSTYLVEVDGTRVAVVQRLHPIFAAEVNLDIDVITAHLVRAGMLTPTMLRTRSGDLWVESGGATWRAMTFVNGITYHRMAGLDQAESSGALVGQFHGALSNLAHRFAFARTGVHDTAAHMARLRETVERAVSLPRGSPLDEAAALAREILTYSMRLPVLADLPARICHGDLKVSNLLYSPTEKPPRAICLIDLDTLGYQLLAYEVGDALRSWCNRSGEDTEEPDLDIDVIAAAMTGYRRGIGDLLTRVELESIAPGLETVCLELAARFCRDVFEDRYFGWDPKQFPNRQTHNLVRTRGQLALAQAVHEQRRDVDAAVLGEDTV
jgi:Ser/Thr protein kinase RdoA (MazF antagonist)